MSASGWPALVKAALLGTERTGRPGIGGSGQVGLLVDVIAEDEERSSEGVLLATAAAVATARRAGHPPERVASGPPPPAPPVDLPPVGPDATATLAALLGGTARPLLGEWLEACASTGRRVPSGLLPAVLDVATATRALRPAAVAALGERGRWLAAQRPEWSWAVGASAGDLPEDLPAAWAEGTAAERRDLLRAERAADPALGLTLVLSTWKQDRVDDRAAFVTQLAEGLSMDDEPFLEERARLDRGRDVRRAAAALLSALPDSRLAARMAERATAHVSLDAGRLVVRLPEDLPVEWEADGIERKARRGIGERAWWLVQVVAATPLDRWGPASAAVAAAVAQAGGEHGEAVLRGWVAAAAAQRRTDWAGALLAAPASALPAEAPASLLQVLDPPARASWLAAALERAPRQGAGRYLDLVGHAPRPWPAPLVRAVAGRAAAAVLGSDPAAHAARPALQHLVERADPTVLDRLVHDLGQASQADRRLEAELRRPLAFAQLRKDLLAELAAPGEPGGGSPDRSR